MAYKPCKYLDVGDKKRITKNDYFECKYEVPTPIFPAAVTKYYNFKYEWPMHTTRIGKDDCAKCPLYEVTK